MDMTADSRKGGSGRWERQRAGQQPGCAQRHPVGAAHGSSRADQTERVRRLAILLWTLGLSHRANSLILTGLGVRLSHITVWRDVQAAAKQVQHNHKWKKVRVLGVDGAAVLGWGEKRPVLVAVDMGTGWSDPFFGFSPTAYVTDTRKFR